MPVRGPYFIALLNWYNVAPTVTTANAVMTANAARMVLHTNPVDIITRIAFTT